MTLTILHYGDAIAQRETDPRDIHICWNWTPARMPGNLYMVICDGPDVRVVWSWLEGDFAPKWRQQPSFTVHPGETVPLRNGWAIRGEAPKPLTLFDAI